MKKRVKKNKPPFISIIIPSLNKGKYIEKTLQSIVDQNYSSLEIIVQDGGSTDNTVSILKRLSQKYSCISWVSKKDGGQLDAIKTGFKKAKGELLAYINADDYYHKGAFEEIAKAYIMSPSSLWFVGYGEIIDDKGIAIHKNPQRYKNFLLDLNYYRVLLMVNYIMQPSVFITRTAYTQYGPFTGTHRYILEYDLWLTLGKVQMPMVIPKILSSFRLAKGSISTSQTINLLNDDETIVSKHTKNPLILVVHKLHNMLRLQFV